VAIVDLANPSAPQLVWTGNTAGIARSIDVAGNTLAIADGDGIAFYDANDGANPRFVGTQNVGGVAWDVVFAGPSLVAATDLGIAIIDRVYGPPQISPSLISISSDGAVSGAPFSVSPAAANVTVRNATTGVTATATPTPTGSFTATLTAKAGHQISLTATDSANRSATRSIGAVPFVTTIRNDAAFISADPAFQARRVAVDGSSWIVTNGSLSGAHINGGSSRALLFRQPDASAPPQIITFDTTAGTIEDLTTRNGFAFVAGDRLATINLAPTPPTVQQGSHACGHELGIAVVGNNAFTTQTDNCVAAGGINIYDVANPLAPVFLRSQSTTINGIVYRALISLGNYLIGISPDKPSGLGHDVTVIDRTNLNSLAKVADLDIANFDAFNAVLDGTTLYLAGGDSGIAIVDVTNPASPVWKSTTDTPGIARSIAVVSATEIVVADAGGPGLTFLDTSDRAHPIVLGSQPFQGNPVDVKVIGNRIYVATETRSYVVSRP
jgi:hypothetical protein